ncbi:MAG: hypothetical protein ABIG11_09480 [bacterium]
MPAATVAAGVMNISGNCFPGGDFRGCINVLLTAVMIALVLVITAAFVSSGLKISACKNGAVES